MKTGFTRREWFAGAAAALGSCSRRPVPLAPVSIHRAGSYSEDLYDLTRRIITHHRLDVRGKRVVLKPNLVEFDQHTVINTHPKLVHAAFEAFRAAGAESVQIAEGPGHRRCTLDLANDAGYFETVPKFESLFTDLNLDEITKTPLIRAHSRLRELYLPNTALACDLLVSMPKMKTHHWVGATLSMKNLFGVVPGGVYGWPKNILHWAGIDQCIADLYRLFPRTFAIVDGIVGMEGNGPIQGTPKAVGVVVAGSNLASVDATCCRVMGINPLKIGYLPLIATRGQLQTIPQSGEQISRVANSFALPPRLDAVRL